MKQYTNEEIILKFQKVHGTDKYIYNRVNYKNRDTKVEIFCIICNKYFEQTPRNHLKIKNQYKCCLNNLYNKKSPEEIIQKFVEKHGNNFNYSKSLITNTKNKIKIICNICNNIFEQSPEVHLRSKYCCPKCSLLGRSKTKTKKINEFIEQAKKVFGDNFDYSKSNYINNKIKIQIICKKCGYDFFQNPKSHLQGHGCAKCNKNDKKTNDWFVSKASEIHNNIYLYNDIYINMKIKIKIICKIHGIFEQSPEVHLQGSGCSKCCNRVSNPEKRWLDFLLIPQEHRQKTIKINKKIYHIDGFDPITNTCYEFNGSYWHGDPRVFNPNSINKVAKKKFKTLYKKTQQKREDLEKAGYTVITMWEYDWDKQNEEISNGSS